MYPKIVQIVQIGPKHTINFQGQAPGIIIVFKYFFCSKDSG